MTREKRRARQIPEKVSVRRPWEPVALARIGRFEDILRGSLQKNGDPSAGSGFRNPN